MGLIFVSEGEKGRFFEGFFEGFEVETIDGDKGGAELKEGGNDAHDGADVGVVDEIEEAGNNIGEADDGEVFRDEGESEDESGEAGQEAERAVVREKT